MKKNPDAYLVVCVNGFARGWVHAPGDPVNPQATMLELEKCCRLRNAMCSCGGKHIIARFIQTGSGRLVED